MAIEEVTFGEDELSASGSASLLPNGRKTPVSRQLSRIVKRSNPAREFDRHEDPRPAIRSRSGEPERGYFSRTNVGWSSPDWVRRQKICRFPSFCAERGKSRRERATVGRRKERDASLAIVLRASHAIQQHGQLGLTMRAGCGEDRLEMRARHLARGAKKTGDLRELSTACDGCRFRFQCETGGVRELKALREMSPAAFSVSIETGSVFSVSIGIDRPPHRPYDEPCRGASKTQMIPVGLRPNAALFSYAAC
jgi:hypothetical protein